MRRPPRAPLRAAAFALAAAVVYLIALWLLVHAYPIHHHR